MSIIPAIVMSVICTAILAPFVAVLYYSFYLVYIPMIAINIEYGKLGIEYRYQPSTGAFTIHRKGSKHYVTTCVTLRQMLEDHTTLRTVFDGGYDRLLAYEKEKGINPNAV